MSNFARELREITAGKRQTRVGLYSLIVGMMLVRKIRKQLQLAAARGLTTYTYSEVHKTNQVNEEFTLDVFSYCKTTFSSPKYGFTNQILIEISPDKPTSDYGWINSKYVRVSKRTYSIVFNWGAP